MKNKKIWNKCLALALSTAMICSSGSVAFASEFTSGDDIATEQTTPESEDGGVSTDKVVPETEQPEAEFDAPEEAEGFDDGTPEVEAFSTEDGVATMADGDANSANAVEITNADGLNNLFESSDSVSIKLTNNIYGAHIEVPDGKNLTIDLNGYKLTNEGSRNNTDSTNAVNEVGNHTIINNGTLKITDSSVNIGTIDNVTHAKAALYNDVGGNATILKGKFIRSKEAGNGTQSNNNSWYYICNHGTMTIGNESSNNDDIEIKSEGSFSSLVENGWQNGNENTTKTPSVMTINAGTFSGGAYTIKNDDCGKMVINGGTFSNTARKCVLNCNEAQINNGTFTATGGATGVVWNYWTSNSEMDKASLEINGGSYNAPSGYCAIKEDEKGSLKLTGGKFNSSDICSDKKYTAKANDDGTYSVAKVAQVGEDSYTTLAEAIQAASPNMEVKLLENIEVSSTQIIDRDITLNLNGKQITSDNVCPVEIRGKVTITDSGENGVIKNTSETKVIYSTILRNGSLTLEKGTIGSNAGKAYGLEILNGTSFKMTGGKVLSTNIALVAIGGASSISIDISGGEVLSADKAIYLKANTQSTDSNRTSYEINTVISGNAIISGCGKINENSGIYPFGIFIIGKGAKLTVNGGEIKGTAYGIVGNGLESSFGTTIKINDGKIEGEEVGIYHPQNGNMTIDGGSIVGGTTGIEIRSGDLMVNGGTITGNGIPTLVSSNGNGTTSDGVGIAVAQHTTKQPINVYIKGGNISGYSAFYESNPQRTPETDIEKVKVDITGGQFKAINGGSVSVYSEDETGFISGGYFSHMPDKKYVATNKRVVASIDSDYPYTIDDKATGKTTVDTAVLETEAKFETGTNIEDNKKKDAIASAKSLEAPGLETEAKDDVSENDINDAKEEAKNAKDENNQIIFGNNVNADSLKIYSTTFFKVEIKDYNNEQDSDKKLTLDIKPMTQLVVSTADSENELRFKTDAYDSNKKQNAVLIGEAKEIKNIKISNLEMSIELPSGFATKDNNGWKPIYVEHIKNGTVYRYTATVTEDNNKQIATFTNPHGFSTFKFTTSAPVASIGEVSYATIQAAINAANGSSTASTIKLLGDVTEENSSTAIDIPNNKNITLDLDGHTLTGNITNNGSLTITDSKGTGKIEGTVTNKKTTTISSGSIQNVTAEAGTISMNGGNITGILATNSGATANVSNGTVNNIKSLGTTNIYGGNINGTITKKEGSVTGTINAYGGTYTDNNKISITPASGYYFDGNIIKSIPAPSLSSNNYLSGLTISQGTLTPAFDRNTTTYTAEVENATDSITVTPVKDSNWASLKVNDKTVASGSASEAIKLAEGANTITIRVTAENGSTKDYTITVTRKAAPGEEYTKLQKAVADYETYKKDGYTESSWAAFEKALKEAQEALKDTSLSEEKAKEILANLTKAAGELQLVGTPVIESVKVSGNKATVKLTGAVENAEGYDYVIGKKDCITTGNYADVRKNKGTATKFSYVQKGTYYAYCHAWKKVDGKKVFGAWSAPYKFTVKVTTVSAPKILSVKAKGRTVTVTLKNGKGIAGVDTVLGKTTVKDQYGKYPSDYDKLVIKNKTTTIIFKNVPKGTYYAGAHAFKRYGSSKSKVFGKWSNIKKVVVK